MKKLLLLCLISVGCSTPNDFINGSPIFNNVDPKLQSYFDTFTQLTGVKTSGITAGFTTLSANIAGECVWGGVWNEVRIDQTDWNEWSLSMKQQLISHELGHCALFLQHINNCSDGTTGPDGTETTCNEGIGMPLSIMNWQMFNEAQANSLSLNPGPYYDYLKLNVPVQ